MSQSDLHMSRRLLRNRWLDLCQRRRYMKWWSIELQFTLIDDLSFWLEYTDDESMRKIVTKGLTTTLATDVANPVYRTTKRKFTNTATITTTTNRPETTTSVFIWWPWSSSTTMPPSVTDPVNTFRYRCILNRQCASIDENSHCTLFGRCVCNMGYRLEVKDDGMQRCVRELSNDDDCDWTNHSISIGKERQSDIRTFSDSIIFCLCVNTCYFCKRQLLCKRTSNCCNIPCIWRFYLIIEMLIIDIEKKQMR